MKWMNHDSVIWLLLQNMIMLLNSIKKTTYIKLILLKPENLYWISLESKQVLNLVGILSLL